VYSLPALTAALGLRKNTLPREIRLGRRLRRSVRAGRVYILGVRRLLAIGQLAGFKLGSDIRIRVIGGSLPAYQCRWRAAA